MRTKYFLRVLLLSLFACLLLSQEMLAQIPQGISYQAVARDNQGYPVANRQIVMELTILQASATGTPVWQETHTVTTDDFGLFNLVIGQGIPTFAGTMASFAQINWANNSYFLKVRADFGESDYINGMVDMGTTQFLAVPYALIADSAVHATPPYLDQVRDVALSTPAIGHALQWDGTNWTNGNYFLRRDGTTDLSGDWTISSNNLTLTNGALALTNGNLTLANGDLTLSNGLLSTPRLILQTGATVSSFSIDPTLGGTSPTTNVVPTEFAVKTYVDNALAATWMKSGTRLYNLTSDIGIGISNPQAKFHAAVGIDAFVVTGTYDAGEDIPTISAATRMGFFGSKAAFRAGYVDDNSWENINVGDYSAAFGRTTKAAGNYSFSAGRNNTASGAYAVSVGNNNLSQGLNSFTSGEGNEAYGLGSSAFGLYNIAESYGEVVVGMFNDTRTGSPGVNPNGWQAQDFAFVVGNGVGGARSNAFVIFKDGKTGIGIDDRTEFTTNVLLAVAGDVRADGVTLTSDRRLKKNITPLSNLLPKTMQLKSVSFEWRNNPQHNFRTGLQYGLIAQDVEKIFPSLVQTDKKGFKSVNYIGLIPVMIQTIQQQQATIDELRQSNSQKDDSIEELNKNYEALSRRLEAIENVLNVSEKK